MLTRRRFLGTAAALAGAVALGVPLRRLGDAAGVAAPSDAGFLDAHRMEVLEAAVARLVPSGASPLGGAAEWGAHDYVQRLLTRGVAALYAGGPVRCDFDTPVVPPPLKARAWAAQVDRWRAVYVDGLDALDRDATARYGRGFAALPGPLQDSLLAQQDLAGTPFFAALYDHTMEGCYSHPVYGGNRGYAAWRAFGFRGDVHGVTRDDPVHDFAPGSGATTQMGMSYAGAYGTNPFGLARVSYQGTVYVPDGWERYARCGMPTGGWSVAGIAAPVTDPEQPVTDALCTTACG